jgi:hypothetical protein
MMHPAKIIIALSILGSSAVAMGQINGSNLLEYQYGKIPGDSSAFSSVYDRAVVKYSQKKFTGAVTLEQYQSPFESRNYHKLTQYSLQYTSEPLEVKIGNFYETIGRGLLLRSFEIPGAVLEDISYRSRHYFNRDVLGFNVKYRVKNLSFKFLFGRPLSYVFPPTSEDKDRRPDNIEAFYADYTFKKHTIGTSVMRLTNKSQTSVFNMISMSGNFSPKVAYYMEFAKNTGNYNLTDFSNQVPYAFYGSLNFSFNRLGISSEYKYYNNFLIGAGINEPPALVKEHSYRVLNRSTHVLQPLNEKGYQLEMFYTLENGSVLTFNNTLAINNFGKNFSFREYFLEYDFYVFTNHTMKVFADYAEDPFKQEEQRFSTGIYTDWKMSETGSFRTDYEFQTFLRLKKRVQNHILNLGYAFGSKIILNATTEWSNDSFIMESKSKIWLATSVKYQINPENNFLLFAGSRRGGPACNAGVCYEVLDFTGVELRLTSRF